MSENGTNWHVSNAIILIVYKVKFSSDSSSSNRDSPHNSLFFPRLRSFWAVKLANHMSNIIPGLDLLLNCVYILFLCKKSYKNGHLLFTIFKLFDFDSENIPKIT